MRNVVCPLPVNQCIAPIDTTAMELRLLSDKIAKATTLVDDLVKRRKIKLRALQSLIGLLSFRLLSRTIGARIFETINQSHMRNSPSSPLCDAKY